MRILVLNNYDFRRTWDLVRERKLPDHLLYGLNHFERAGHVLDLAPFRVRPRWSRFDAWMRRRHLAFFTGDTEQQAAAFRRARDADLIYAPCQTQSQLLCVLRALRILRKPVVCLAHHPLHEGRLNRVFRSYVRLLLRGTDRYPSLTAAVALGINRIARDDTKSPFVQWGPDRAFYPPPAPGPGHGIVASGFSGRDYATFLKAAAHARSPVTLLCPAGQLPGQGRNLPPSCRVWSQPHLAWHFDEQLMNLYRQARALAIPLLAGPLLSGLTSLVDALGFGKAVLMTRHPLIDLDVEREGIGRWVEPGDHEGWRRAIAYMEDHPEEAAAMGRRARALVDRGLNSESFATSMLRIFEQSVNPTARSHA